MNITISSISSSRSLTRNRSSILKARNGEFASKAPEISFRDELIKQVDAANSIRSGNVAIQNRNFSGQHIYHEKCDRAHYY